MPTSMAHDMRSIDMPASASVLHAIYVSSLDSLGIRVDTIRIGEYDLVI
jgi:hypothetical protein